MIHSRIQSGQAGEEMCVRFLERHGYRIIERNFRNKIGEIDIIAKEGEMLCFIEVKLRNSESRELPFESVTQKKQIKLTRVAESYLKFKHIDDIDVRFDVMAVLPDVHGRLRVEIIKNAFEAQVWSG